MKQKLIIATLTAFLFVACSVSFSQVNSYFLNNPVWQISSSCSAPYPCIQNETYNYYLNGDTIFNSLVYKKIYKKGLSSYTWSGGIPVPLACTGSYNF